MLRKSLFAAGVVGAGVGAFTLAQDAESPLYTHIMMPGIAYVDPETAHKWSVRLAALGISPIDESADDPSLKVTLWGKEFRNCVGLAAGYDKNAETMESMLAMGFGFVEVGSVCPLPQPGNVLPRVFRLRKEGAIINRYGFNSQGVEPPEARLKEFRKRQSQIDSEDLLAKIKEFVPGYLRRKKVRTEGLARGIVGVNLGKNKESVMPALIEDKGQIVLDDYSIVAERLGPYADYLVVNVSSPNTPNLRDLQGAKELTAILTRLQRVRERMNCSPKPPILIKIAPDITAEQAQDIAQVALEMQVDGIIVSNTTLLRPAAILMDEESRLFASQAGGLSGKPLRDISTKLLGEMYRLTGGKIPLIGVGGISNGKDAFEKIKAGASLVQLYSALALEGPVVVPKIKRELAALLKANNLNSVQEAVGMAHREQIEKNNHSV